MGRNKQEEILSFLCPSLLIPLCIVHTLKTKHDTFKCKLYLQLGLDNNSISIYIYCNIFFSIMVIWFLNKFTIFQYTLPVFPIGYIDLFVALTSLNKHEHCMFQNQNAVQVFYMNVSLKGTNCLQKCFDGIFILSDCSMSAALLCVQPLPGKPLFLPLQKHLLLAENDFAFSVNLSPATCFCCCSLLFSLLSSNSEHVSYSLSSLKHFS